MHTLRNLTVALLIPGVLFGQVRTPEQQRARDIFQELIEINTTNSVGSTTDAAAAMAARLRAAGFSAEDVQVLGPHPKKGNLVARFRGTGERQPLLLLAHVDVVEALRSDWSFDPFTLLEQDGYFYGRGTTDDKAMSAIWIANLIRYKEEGFTPNRDIIVALTADEEGGTHNGVVWLINNHRDLIDAEYALNEGGGGQIKDGMRISNNVQASEKVYQSFQLEITNPGGHSSVPQRDNAIYRLSEALVRIADHEFPVKLNEITGGFFKRSATLAAGEEAEAMRAIVTNPSDEKASTLLSERPYYNAILRTTCVATRLEAGHADNALPQTARAVVNCRILPGEPPEHVQATLVRVIGDDGISVVATNPATPSPPSPLTPEIMRPVERITNEMWPGVVVIPTMLTGATDGLFLRNAGIPVYGVSGIFGDIDDIRAHGKDERLLVESYYEGLEFLYRLVKELAN